MTAKGALVFLMIAAQAWPAAGATIIYRVRLDIDGPKTYRVTVAVVGDDNGGLVTYGASLSGSGITLEHLSPFTYEGRKGDEYAPAGFSIRALDPPPLSFVGGHQQVNPTLDPQAFPIYNFGKNAGSFAAEGISPSATLHFPVWDAELVVGKGTYTSVPPQLVVPRRLEDATGNVFANATSTQYRKADRILYNVPEPSAYTMAGVALLALFALQTKRVGLAVTSRPAVLSEAHPRN